MAGQVGIIDHLTIGDNVTFAAGSGVSKSISEPGIYWGRPAKPIAQMRRLEGYFRRLPEIFKRVKALESKDPGK